MEETRNDVVEVMTDETAEIVNTEDVTVPEIPSSGDMALIGGVVATVASLAVAGMVMWKKHKKKKAAKKAEAETENQDDARLSFEVIDGELVENDDN